MKPTHTYKGKPVEFIKLSYVWNEQQYCTILMVNATGKTQLQTIQERHLKPFVPDEAMPQKSEGQVDNMPRR
jgi:hypothetical protein